MKVKILKTQLGGMTPALWLRQAGYGYIVDHNSGQDSFVRRLSGDHYPRFHLYIQTVPGSDELFFNIHLDQKKASYVGQARHSGEYEGELVDQEVARLKSYLHTEVKKETVDPILPASEKDVLQTLRPKKMVERPEEKKKPWWQRLFS